MGSSGIRDQVAIIGMGCTRFGELWDKGVDDLMIESSTDAAAWDSCNPGGTTGLQFSVGAGRSGEQGDTSTLPKPGDIVVASIFQSSSTTEAEPHDLSQHAYIFSTSAGNSGATIVFIGTLANPLHELDTFTKSRCHERHGQWRLSRI